MPPEQAITNELNKKYANRILHEVGLCVCVFDLAEVGEGKVRYGDGFLWYKGAQPGILHAARSLRDAASHFPYDGLQTVCLRGDSREGEVFR